MIHFYVAASKSMVQPGQENLINFISLIPRLRHLPEDNHEWESEQTAEMPTETYKFPLQVNLQPIEKELIYNECRCIIGLNIFYFIYMKRDWEEHRCYVEALSHTTYTIVLT